LQAREDERRQAVFTSNLWRCRQRRKKKKKEQNELASPSCYSPCRASHFTGPPFVYDPAEKGRPTSLRRGEGLAAVVPGERERDEREAVAVVVVGDKRDRSKNF